MRRICRLWPARPLRIAAVTMAIVSPSLAADKAPETASESANPWDGFYAGGHIAPSFGNSRYFVAPSGLSGNTPLKVLDNQFGPLVGGVHVGWNHVFRNGLFAGFEGDMTFPNRAEAHRVLVDGAGVADHVGAMQAWGTLRARVGMAMPDYLLFVTGGVALARQDFTRSQFFGTSLAGTSNAGDDDDTASLWRFGYSAGAGIEAMLFPRWSGRLEYQFASFGRTGANFRVAGDRLTSDLRIHSFRLGLTYRFNDAEESKDKKTLLDPDMFSIHGQTTQVGQTNFPFRARYSGPFSLYNGFQTRETVSVTGNLGFRPWEGTEFYFNPEPLQGFGLSKTHGVAGFPNGEAQKAGFSYPHYNSARLFVRQTIGLGGEQEKIEDGANQFAGKVDVSRLTITAGKIAVPDIFDGNTYSHDQRTQFLNFSFFDGGAFDYAADQKGYTYGAALELNQKQWAARVGYFLEPSVPNGAAFDTRLGRRGQYIGELEGRYSILGQPGKLRLIAWFARSYSGSFFEVNNNPAFGGDITQTRKGRPEHGYVVNLEQAISDDLGFFSRYSWRDGRNEIIAFTDIDRSFSIGGVLKGTSWGRPKDKIGAAFAVNALTDQHRQFFANGGLGINIGDGLLTYRREAILETYYALNLNESSTLTFDYQFIANPAYNADRGPVSVWAARLHTEF